MKKKTKFNRERYSKIMPIIRRAENPDNLPFSISFTTGTVEAGAKKAMTTAQAIWAYYRQDYADLKKSMSPAERTEYKNAIPSIKLVENKLVICGSIRRGLGNKYTIHSREGDIDVEGGIEI